MPTGETYIIPTKMDTTGVKAGVLDIKGELLDLAKGSLPIWGVGAAVGFVTDQMVGAVRETMAYAKEVKGLSLASGATAEQSSRLIQVLDDYGVTTEMLLRSTKKLTDSGYAPTIDTIIDLSAEYQSLTSVQEQNAFITDNLGKNTAEWHNVLSKGPDLLREQNALVNEANILTEAEIIKVREAEIAMDAWSDAVAGAKTEMSIGLMPVLTDLLSATMTITEAQGKQVKWWEYLVPAVGSLHSLYIGLTDTEKDAAVATQAHNEALAEQASQADNARLALQGLDKEVRSAYWHQSGGFTYQGEARPTYSGVPNRASGGPVIAGQAYNVAEFFRPEVFTPSTSGRVDPVTSGTQRVEAHIDEERLVRIFVSALQQGALA
jgi:hypothetical protein